MEVGERLSWLPGMWEDVKSKVSSMVMVWKPFAVIKSWLSTIWGFLLSYVFYKG